MEAMEVSFKDILSCREFPIVAAKSNDIDVFIRSSETELGNKDGVTFGVSNSGILIKINFLS